MKALLADDLQKNRRIPLMLPIETQLPMTYENPQPSMLFVVRGSGVQRVECRANRVRPAAGPSRFPNE
jgi:hypothetical protein